MQRSSQFDVAVVGAGAIGLAVAWRAAQRGLSVLLAERGRPGAGTSAVAAGMLAPITEARLSEQPLLHLGMRSAASYSAFVAELRECSGIDPGYIGCGTLVVARDQDEVAVLERELELRERLELPASRLRASEARRLEPALAPGLRLALEVPDDHAVDPRRLTAALLEAARGAGVHVRTGAQVAALRCSGDHAVAGVELADGELIEAEQVVLAAGPWCGSIAGLPGHARVPIHPVKGQVLRMHDPAGPGLIGRVLRTGGCYLVPRGDGNYVLGATMEERGFDTTVTAGAIFELLRDIREVLPGVDELVVDELCAGLRPATADNAPAIGPGALRGLHWATGHHRNGILLTPVTAELVVAGLLGEELPPLAAAFSPARLTPVPVDA